MYDYDNRAIMYYYPLSVCKRLTPLVTNRRNIYLGEWHTHPAKRAQSSRQDQAMHAEQYRQNDIQTPFLLMFIVGLDEVLLGLYDGHRLLSKRVQFAEERSRE